MTGVRCYKRCIVLFRVDVRIICVAIYLYILLLFIINYIINYYVTYVGLGGYAPCKG